jgi:hypothetical protein
MLIRKLQIFLFLFILEKQGFSREDPKEILKCSLCTGNSYCSYKCEVPPDYTGRYRYCSIVLGEFSCKMCNMPELGCPYLDLKTAGLIECYSCPVYSWCPTPEHCPWEASDENLRPIRILALFSELIYKLPHLNIPKLFQTFGTDDLTTFGAVIFYPKENSIYVVFRGSENLLNWVDHTKFIKTPAEDICKGCEVHQGWYNNYLNLKLQLTKLLSEFKQSHNVAITFTGHSYGAALATLAYADLKKSLKNPTSLYTFGSPRVGNKEFADHTFNFRIVYGNDLVTDLPPKILGYVHSGTEWHFPSKDQEPQEYDQKVRPYFAFNWLMKKNIEFQDYDSKRWSKEDHSKYVLLGDRSEDVEFVRFMDSILQTTGLESLKKELNITQIKNF